MKKFFKKHKEIFKKVFNILLPVGVLMIGLGFILRFIDPTPEDFVRAKAIISSIGINLKDESYAYIDYNVDGIDYHRKLDTFEPNYKEGAEIAVAYDPLNPRDVIALRTSDFSIVCWVLGGLSLATCGGISIMYLIVKKEQQVAI